MLIVDHASTALPALPLERCLEPLEQPRQRPALGLEMVELVPKAGRLGLGRVAAMTFAFKLAEELRRHGLCRIGSLALSAELLAKRLDSAFRDVRGDRPGTSSVTSLDLSVPWCGAA